ncbi:hypothetical protein QEZ54_27995 [Catellatospora sp. KI3]|uniref:hypothetical protein n=1 Tax=Catellatospora sp. KI3 TaxID=3041620 RepID=UPI0024826BF8|nr:hypothetical protein [Catellatospora sp. KI3]MDI1464818.1 hypothetical protein [Catellatospora sp. KI3]
MPHPAATARTIACGHHAGIAQVPWADSPFRVRHAVDSVGRPLLLVRVGGALDRALTPRDGDEDTAMVLAVGGDRSRVWISGWATGLAGLAARAAALEFAEANPASDLLDVGRGFRLYRLDVAEVRLQCPAGHLTDVDADDYAAAEPEVSSSPVR